MSTCTINKQLLLNSLESRSKEVLTLYNSAHTTDTTIYYNELKEINSAINQIRKFKISNITLG